MKARRSDYSLVFSSLSLGNHEFEYELSDEFFKEADLTDLSAGNVKVHLELEKKERMMILNFHFQGVVDSVCDRCLKTVGLAVDAEDQVIVQFVNAEETEDSGDEHIWRVKDTEVSLEFQAYFREVLMLQRPMQLFCGDGTDAGQTCDPDMLARLSAQEESVGSSVDPRWEALKKLKV